MACAGLVAGSPGAWTLLCPGASTTDLGVPHVLIFTVGLTSWTTSSTFSSSSTTTWQQDLREFDFVEPYSVRTTSVSVLFFCGVGALASSSLPLQETFFYFDVGGDSCLLAWRVLASLLARLVQWTLLCSGASTTDLGVPHVLLFAGGLTSWTTSSSFSSSSTATWQLDLREFDAVEPYGVRAATFLELCCCGWSSPPPCESTGGIVHSAACLTPALLPGVTAGNSFNYKVGCCSCFLAW